MNYGSLTVCGTLKPTGSLFLYGTLSTLGSLYYFGLLLQRIPPVDEVFVRRFDLVGVAEMI
jgi:hypothetical protein